MEKKLHLGCGAKILEGFINVDMRDLSGVDIPNCDVTNLSMFDRLCENATFLRFS